MHSLKSNMSLLLLIGIIFNICLAMPGLRVKRQDAVVAVDVNDIKGDDGDLNPINTEDVSNDELERNKRKLPDATFEAKNAVLGFFFGKIDNFLDTKTRVIEQLDRANVEKNKQWDIKPPVPIKDLQTLVTAVVSPKIRSLGNIANDLTTGVLTTITAFSGSSSGGNSNNPNAGLGNIVSKILGFSGPILQGSAGTPNNPGGVTPAPDSDEAGY